MVIAILAAIYFVAGTLGLKLASVHASSTAVWPPTGITLAALLLLGYRVWPGIFLGAFLVNLTTTGYTAISFATSIGIATGNTLEGLVGAWLVERFANGRNAFNRPRDIFKFTVLAGAVSTAVSATFGVTSLALGGLAHWTNYGPIWLTWWLGDMSGDLVVAPLLLIWWAEPRIRWSRRQLLEVSLLLGYLFAVGEVVFGGWFPIGASNYPLALAVPLVVAAAFRFGQRETATAIFMLAGIALWGTVHGFGPFVGATQNEALLLLQCFLGVTVVLAMPLAAVVSEHKRAEAKLESSERRFRQLAENIHDAFWIRDLQRNRVLYASPAYEAIWGLSRAGLYADPQSFLNAVHLEDRAQVLDWLAQQSRGQNTVREYRIVRPDGNIRWIRDRAYPVRNDAGEVCRVTGVAEDVTQKKEAEQAVHESEQRMRAVLETAVEGIITIDERGVVESLNPAACRIFGYQPAEVIGQNVSVLMPSPDREEHDGYIANYFRTGQAKIIGIGREVVGQRKDGTPFPMDLSISEVRLADRRLFTGMVRDITERKRAEKAVRENEAKFRAVFEKSVDAIGVSRQGIHMLVNPAYLKLFGFEQPEELVGRPVFELLAPGERPRVREFIECRGNGEAAPARYESRGLRRDGAEFDLDIDASAFELDGERHTLVILRDITGQKRARVEIERLNAELEARVARRTRQLEDANRELEAFSYSVSHDLRAPLRAIDGFAHILLDDYSPKLDERGRRLFEVIRENTRKMNRLIEDILAFSKFNRAELSQGPVDMTSLARSVVQDLILPEPARPVKIAIQNLPTATGDTAMLRQVFANLISNALKFTRKTTDPAIDIGAWQEGPEATYYVRDNGVGFDAKYGHKLFNLFQRLHKSEDFEGTGVGLAIIQRIIHRHGGRVWAESKAHAGACFYFALPADDSPLNPVRPPVEVPAIGNV